MVWMPTTVTSVPSRFTSATPERDRVLPAGTWPFREVQHLVLEEDDRVVVADGGLQQALGIGGRDWA